jgi:NAD(P)-dependent dehydrogenase (short-subunit alcohol dehydrogenase family)
LVSGVLLVTGGSRGIGAATARLAAERGYAVCVNYRIASIGSAQPCRCGAAGKQWSYSTGTFIDVAGGR